jgi:hypothetical protein
MMSPQILLTAAGIVTLIAFRADGAAMVASLSIKFGADEVNGVGGQSFVDSAAGVLNTATWNNTQFLSGGPTPLNQDLAGVSTPTTATVTWSSPNTWTSTGRTEENNTATGENRDLMAGYIDTLAIGGQGAIVTVTGLNFPASPFTLGYDIYVYIQGGVNARGGTYSIGTGDFYHEVTTAFDGTFVEDTTPDTPTGPEGSFGSNYLVFRNVSGDSFTLTSAATFGGTPRAPINAIEVVAVPEPVNVAAIAGGVALLLGWRRRHSM